MFERFNFLKPAFSTATTYTSGLSEAKTYNPASLDVVSIFVFETVLVAVTFAPGTEAPLLSNTVPLSDPVATCPNDKLTASKMPASNVVVCLIVICPHLFSLTVQVYEKS